MIGGSIGYTTYYNIFVNYFTTNAVKYMGAQMVAIGITNETYIAEAIMLTSESLVDELYTIPGIAGNETAWNLVLQAGQVAYAESYKYIYLVSIAFGTVSIVAACFVKNIDKYMTDNIAVHM